MERGVKQRGGTRGKTRGGAKGERGVEVELGLKNGVGKD